MLRRGSTRSGRERIAPTVLTVAILVPVVILLGAFPGTLGTPNRSTTISISPLALPPQRTTDPGPPSWHSVSMPWSPSAQYAASIAYDAADGYTVLFGGCIPSGEYGLFCGPSNTTAILKSGYWAPANSALNPPARYAAAMAYDPIDGYVLLFGGLGNGYGSFNDTWSFSHGQWINRTTAIAPPGTASALGGAGLVYDADLHAMLYYGGSPGTTWTYSHGVWSQLTTADGTGPSVDDVMMAYDAATGQAILFGGSGLGEPVGTWTFSSGTWTNISASLSNQPPPNVFGTMAYDPLDGYVVLYGGASSGIFPTYFTATWAFADGVWTDVTGSAGVGASPTYGAAAFDPSEGDLVAFGGHGSGGNGAGTFSYGEPLLQVGWNSSDPIDATANGTFSTSIEYSGGDGPFNVAVTGGPTGCTVSEAGSNTLDLTCVSPAAVGSYEFNASLSDSRAGGVPLGARTLNVTAPATSSSGGSALGFLASPTGIGTVSAAAVLVVGVLVVVLTRRRRSQRLTSEGRAPVNPAVGNPPTEPGTRPPGPADGQSEESTGLER